MRLPLLNVSRHSHMKEDELYEDLVVFEIVKAASLRFFRGLGVYSYAVSIKNCAFVCPLIIFQVLLRYYPNAFDLFRHINDSVNAIDVSS